MTVSTRNRLLVGLFALSLLPIAALVVDGAEILGALPEAASRAEVRSGGAFAGLSALAEPSAYAPAFAAAASLLYAASTIALLYFFFEATFAPEMLFLAFFAFSFAVEPARFAVPLAVSRDWPPAFVVAGARVLLFGRFMGLFSIFASSVYASGIDFQKHGRIVLIVLIASAGIAVGVPVDGLAWDAAIVPVPGYLSVMRIAEYTISAITVASFLVAAYSRGAREFAFAALGCALLILGKEALVRADSWIAAPLGLAALVAGTALIMNKIHRYYMWL